MTEQQACTLCGAGGHTAAQCNWNKADDAPLYSEGICQDGAAILRDGVPVPVAEIIEMLNSSALAQPSPAPELERPEVDDFAQVVVDEVKHAYHERKSISEASAAIMAQHDRIVGALRARNEWLEQVAVEAAETEQHAKSIADGLRYKAELYDEAWSLVTGKGYMNVTTAIAKLEQERDAAQARVDVATQILRNARNSVTGGLHIVISDFLAGKAPVAQAGQVPDAFNLLRALITGTTGRWILSKLDDGQGTGLEDGKNWLAAREIVRAAPAHGGE